MADPLYKDDEDDKCWKKTVREAKEDAQSRRRGGYSSYSRRGQGNRDGYRRQYGDSFRGRSGGNYGRYKQRRYEKVKEKGSRMVFGGMMREPVTTVVVGHIRAQCQVKKEGKQ